MGSWRRGTLFRAGRWPAGVGCLAEAGAAPCGRGERRALPAGTPGGAGTAAWRQRESRLAPAGGRRCAARESRLTAAGEAEAWCALVIVGLTESNIVSVPHS